MWKYSLIGLATGFLIGFQPQAGLTGSSQDVIDFLEEKGVISKEKAESFEEKGGPILSLRSGMVKIGGELELEFIKSERNTNPDPTPPASQTITYDNNPNSRMSIDKFVLSPEVHLSDQIMFRADIEAEGAGKIKVDEAWIQYKGLPFHSWMTIGLEDIFMKPHRKTEAYPILGYAFWQDEDLGIYLGGEHEMVYWRLSFTNGRRLADRRAQEDNVFPITTDDDDNVEKNGNKQVGVGIGIDLPIKENHKIDILPFYYHSRLSGNDVAYLQGISTYGASNGKKQERYGFNFDYLLNAFTLFAQVMRATDGIMDRDGWYIQSSYKIKCKERKTFNAFEFLLRYEEYNVDLTKDPTDSRTWDRETITLAILTDVVKNTKVKTEYYFNDESTGGNGVNNNEFLVQLEVKF